MVSAVSIPLLVARAAHPISLYPGSTP